MQVQLRLLHQDDAVGRDRALNYDLEDLADAETDVDYADRRACHLVEEFQPEDVSSSAAYLDGIAGSELPQSIVGQVDARRLPIEYVGQ